MLVIIINFVVVAIDTRLYTLSHTNTHTLTHTHAHTCILTLCCLFICAVLTFCRIKVIIKRTERKRGMKWKRKEEREERERTRFHSGRVYFFLSTSSRGDRRWQMVVKRIISA